MKNQFVPYELAVKLKELGFYETCFARHRKGKFEFQTLGKPYDYNSNPIVDGDISAPLWQQAFDWFREEGVISWIDRNDNTFRYNIEFSNGSILGLQGFVTYEEARLACLEKLIELVS